MDNDISWNNREKIITHIQKVQRKMSNEMRQMVIKDVIVYPVCDKQIGYGDFDRILQFVFLLIKVYPGDNHEWFCCSLEAIH